MLGPCDRPIPKAREANLSSLGIQVDGSGRDRVAAITPAAKRRETNRVPAPHAIGFAVKRGGYRFLRLPRRFAPRFLAPTFFRSLTISGSALVKPARNFSASGTGMKFNGVPNCL